MFEKKKIVSELSKIYGEQKDVNGEVNSIHLQEINNETIDRLQEGVDELKEKLYNAKGNVDEIKGIASALNHMVQTIMNAYMVASDKDINEKIEKNTLSQEHLKLANKYNELNAKSKHLTEDGKVNLEELSKSVEDILTANGEEEKASGFKETILKIINDGDEELLLSEVKKCLTSTLDEIIEQLEAESADNTQKEEDNENQREEQVQRQGQR
jgi:hypothetical protein